MKNTFNNLRCNMKVLHFLILFLFIFPLFIQGQTDREARKAKCQKKASQMDDLIKSKENLQWPLNNLDESITFARKGINKDHLKAIINRPLFLDAQITYFKLSLEQINRIINTENTGKKPGEYEVLFQLSNENILKAKYYSAALDDLMEIRALYAIYGDAIKVEDVHFKGSTEFIKYCNSLIQSIDKAQREIQAKIDKVEDEMYDMSCYLYSPTAPASPDNAEGDFIKKIVGGWTDKPTPWGTAGGPCQIKYTNKTVVLVNENKDESVASVLVNADGSGTISATKWGVTGEVDATAKSVKWSNKSEWVR